MNPHTGWINRVVHFQWDLLDKIARRNPKLGEMVAFRPPIEPIDPDTVVDEAALEAQLTNGAGTLAYVPQAHVSNLGPQTLTDLIAQRERIWMGHLRLHQRTGYRVSTFRVQDLLTSTLAFLVSHPSQLPVAVVAAGIESFARIRGTYRLRIHGELPTVWPRLLSAKIL
jgi:cellulose synthase/poly-beta-1,6-N-acetylglucosamine synthase-like glycosyltransferase